MSNPFHEHSKECRVYLPPGYDANHSQGRFPVIYLLHGVRDTQHDWHNPEGRKGNLATFLAASPKIPPMILVMANTLPASVPRDRDGFPQFDPFREYFWSILQDVEAIYVGGKPGYRGIAGISMGGRLALQLAFSDLHSFQLLAVWSSAIRGLDLFEFPILRSAADVNAQLRLFYLRCENDEQHRNYRLDRHNMAFSDELRRRGIRCDAAYRAGPHSWIYWNEELELFLQLVPAA